MSVHALNPDAGFPGPVSASIRALLLQARRYLAHDLESAVRCIEGAVGLLPEDGGGAVASDARLEAQRGGLAPWQMLRVKAHIDAHLDGQIFSTDLAAAARLSASHFTRAFRASFGDTPLAYVSRCRLARAKALMLDTKDSLADIALSCGLADQPHLCRLFRRFEGLSPAAWRRARMAPAAGRLLVN